MKPDFRSYLAEQIIAEKQTISYRNVSRALKVHVNLAKCMLYDFWEKENKKKATSVYATYLVAGVKKENAKLVLKNGHASRMEKDDPAPSSPPPPPSSMMDFSQRSVQTEEQENVPVRTVSLVREENVESTKAQYEIITSIHIYSLSPGRLEDLVVLTDISRGLFADSIVKEDPLTSNQTYGVIQNPGVRKRKGKRLGMPDAPKPNFQPTKDEKNKRDAAKLTQTSTRTAKETKEDSRPGSRDSSTSAASTKGPTLKRDGSNLFKAFAKAQNKPKLKRDDTDASTNVSVSGNEDVKMVDADEEGESEDEALFLDTGAKRPGTRKRAHDVKKEREDKQAKLRKMMDSDDEEEKALPNVEDATDANAEPPAAKKGDDEVQAVDKGEGDDDVAWSESDTEQQRRKAPAKDTSTNQDGEQISTQPKRRRGKRKVMKKRTTKDEDGYLVTKEEPVWESYSEDEPEPAKEKSKPAFSSVKSQSQPGSQKSTAGAKGATQQKKGNIMSFFGKK